jgi:hypothetical protein
MALMLAKLYTALRSRRRRRQSTRGCRGGGIVRAPSGQCRGQSDDSEMDGWIQPRLDDRHSRHAVLRARQRTRRQRSSDRHGHAGSLTEALFRPGRFLNFTPMGVISNTVPNNFPKRSRDAFSPSGSVRLPVTRGDWGGDPAVMKKLPGAPGASYQLVHLAVVGHWRRQQPLDEGQRLLDHRGRGRGRRLRGLPLGWLGRPGRGRRFDELRIVEAQPCPQNSSLLDSLSIEICADVRVITVMLADEY